MNIHKLMLDIAPEEEYQIKGKTVIVRRDDKAYLPPLPPNAKMGALYALVKRASEQGYKEVMIFAKKQQGTSYATGLPVFANEFGMKSTIVVPLVRKSNLFQPQYIYEPWMIEVMKTGTEILPLHPNMVTINVNQCKKIAQERGAYFIPFGFDDLLSIETHANKFSLPDYQIGTLITATMTGMILAGLIKQIEQRKYKVGKIVGVSGGRDGMNILTSIMKYVHGFNNVIITNPYGRNFDALHHINHFYKMEDRPFEMHPDYEAKAWLWILEHIEELREPIYFINVGR